MARKKQPKYPEAVLAKIATGDPLKPSAGLLCKLGSAIVHADEFLSPDGHEFDSTAFRQVLADPEVQDWIRQMTKLAFLPRKRNDRR